MLNFLFVLRQLGLLTFVLSVSLLLVTVVTMPWLDLTDAEWVAERAMLLTVVVAVVVGMMLWLVGRRGRDYMGRREALLLVALSWGLGAALAGLPYWLWAILESSAVGHPFRSFAACYFEAMSGLTTTGATVLSEVGQLPRGLLLWRAMTHWLGGLGIVVLFVAVLPTLGVGGKKLYAAEASGPTTQGVRPRIKETARVLWMIYLLFTIVETLLLWAWGMTPFDALCHTFATLATGGFSTYNASIGYYNSVAIDITIIFFMILAGVNFGLYYHVMRGRFKNVYKDPELQVYLSIIVVASVIVVWSLYGTSYDTTRPSDPVQNASLGQSVRDGVFQVVSIQTTTGFCTANFNQWSTIAKAVLLVLMFIGGSAGSTGGGIKVIRCVVAVKVMLAEVERIFRPNVVRTVKVGRWSVDPELRQGTIIYVLGILLLAALGTILLMLLEGGGLNFTSAATASIATLNNIGPGLEAVGAVENYGHFGAASKIVMSVLMALGRLEVYAVLVLFVPTFWRSE